MNQKVWEQKKKNALDLLQRLLNAWEGRMLLDDIDTLGPQVNNAVLMLELEGIELPLPYDEEKMSSRGMFASVLGPEARSQELNSEISQNIKAWIQEVEKAECKLEEEKSPTLSDIQHPVECTLVAGIVHKRSDNIARSLTAVRLIL